MGTGDSAAGEAAVPTHSDIRQLEQRSEPSTSAFAQLIRREEQWLAERVGKEPPAAPPLIRDDAAEPWVAWRPRDHFGLALSGGGIRSATFSLGVLQALSRRPAGVEAESANQCSVLDFVDYVSTVSGGGYVGGFWSRWLHAAAGEPERAPGLIHRMMDGYRAITQPPAPAVADPNAVLPAPKQAQPAPSSRWQRLKQAMAPSPSKAPRASLLRKEDPIFPQPPRDAGDLLRAEAPAIRHLREHSRFLMPRVGLFAYQTWGGLVALLGAMLPSLVLAAAVLTLVWHLWLGLAYVFLNDPWLAGGVFTVVAAVIFTRTEQVWRRLAENRRDGLGRYVLGATLSSLFLGGVHHLLLPSRQAEMPWPCLERDDATAAALFYLDDCAPATFLPVIPWVLVAGGLLLLLRPLLSSVLSPTSIRVIERISARCLVPALVWAFFAATWALSLRLRAKGMEIMMPATAVTTAGAAGLFVALRNWFSKPVQETRGSRAVDRAMAVLRPLLPQVLAYAAALGMLLMVGVAIAWVAVLEGPDGSRDVPGPYSTWPIFGAIAIVLLALVLDPRRIGLHEFYRSRIAGTFLGGWTDEKGPVEEDATFEALRTSPRHRRPIHLICTTGNDLSGDPLPGLYRGGRSVAISPLGVSLGRHASSAPIDSLPLSSALTASAAAFNSQMGSVSIRLGPAVSFVMSSLGLRLGLWLDHPGGGPRWAPPGWRLFTEMGGRSRAQVGDVDAGEGSLHLSDGGHFENLALYELVRRHCRFILVCDAGADPEVAFDDLANATRRVREDFGVEIELDVEPLRPNADGFAKQHAVIGTIHYGGVGGVDKGILLYFKPTLVGDEPTDVMQYRTRNPRFPHESTGDQFYDEAQWEAYRRLGEHCAGTVFRFVEDRGLKRRDNEVERLFLNALQRWQPIRNVDPERLSELAERRDALLAEIRERAPERFRRELFADASSALGLDRNPEPDPEEVLRGLQYCIALATLMNQIHHAARLETHWAHPSNQTWMAFLHRAASCTSFRRWWPLLRPLCDDAVRDFVRVRFGILVGDPAARRGEDSADATVTLSLREARPGRPSYAAAQWEERFGRPQRGRALEYVATLRPWPGESAPRELVVGLLLFDQRDSTRETIIEWSTPELFVPPELSGSGFSSRLLDAVIHHFSQAGRPQGPTRYTLTVTIADEPSREASAAGGPPSSRARPVGLRLDPAHRKAREASLHFYKSRGFCQPPPSKEYGLHRPLELQLDAPPQEAPSARSA